MRSFGGSADLRFGGTVELRTVEPSNHAIRGAQLPDRPCRRRTNMKGAAAVARILKQEGVECLFCFPINQVIDAGAEFGIRPIMARTERAVMGMADGYSRATNG